MLNKYSDEIVFVEIYSLSLRESNVVIFKEKEKKNSVEVLEIAKSYK